MKNFLFLFITVFVLHSCSINSEIIYHKDAATTTMMDIDMKDIMSMMKSMMPDSTKNDKKEFAKLEKLPKIWTSLYDMQKSEGKLKTNNPDSIIIIKKIFMKSTVENNKISGFSFKMDHFSKEDYNSVKSISKNEKLPIDQLVMNTWDGKTLTIDTEKLSLNGIKNILAKKGVTDGDDKEEMSIGSLKMAYKKIGTTLKFENKIKSITGKHDWITKVDDHSLRIDYDLDYLFDEEKDKKQLKNADKKIIVVTE